MSKEISKKVFKSGLQKENVKKTRYDLIPYEILIRVANQFSYGAEKYGENNWRLGNKDETDIFKQSAFRHLFQWANGETDEDHAAALITNLMMFEWLNKNKK